MRAFGFRGASEELGHLAAYSRLEFHLQIEMQIAEHFISKASVIPASCLLCPPRGYVDGYVRGYVPLLGTTSRTERVRGRPVICIQQVAPAGGREWPLSSLTSLPSVYTDTTVFRITRSTSFDPVWDRPSSGPRNNGVLTFDAMFAEIDRAVAAQSKVRAPHAHARSRSSRLARCARPWCR